MSLTYVGSLSLAALCPIVELSIGQVAISLNASLQGNLSLNASLQANPPTLALAIAAGADFEANLQLAIDAIPPVPSVSFSLSDCLSLTASLEAGLSLLVELEALLDVAIEIFAFGYVGSGNGLGSDVTNALASSWPDGTPSSGACNAFLFGAATPIAEQQIASFLGGIPFGSGLEYGGKIGLGVLSPVTLDATSQGEAGIGAQLSATEALKASTSVALPSLATMLEAQAKFLANLKVQVALPSVSFALSATASAAASLSAKFGLLCKLGASLERADATLFVYRYSGVANALGAAITTALASTWGDGRTSTSGACSAALLGTTDTASFVAMSSFFGGA